MRKQLGKAVIYYPVLNAKQIKSYLISHVFVSGEDISYSNARPYTSWDWLCNVYNIKHNTGLDISIKTHYVVLIVGNDATFVKITPENYDTEHLHGKTAFDIQEYLLLKASKKICRSGTHFYRYSFKGGRFEYKDKRLPFAQIVRIAQDKNYTSDDVFIDYMKYVSESEIEDLLSTLLVRYIRGCKRTGHDISKSDWINHTKMLLATLNDNAEIKNEIKEKALSFCEEQSKSKSKAPSTQITAHYVIDNKKFSENFFKKLYSILVAEGYIEPITTEAEFLFFFCGKFGYPSNKIKWRKKNIMLALLIAELHKDNTSAYWKATEQIFENVKGNNLKKQYSNSGADSKSERTVKQIIERAK